MLCLTGGSSLDSFSTEGKVAVTSSSTPYSSLGPCFAAGGAARSCWAAGGPNPLSTVGSEGGETTVGSEGGETTVGSEGGEESAATTPMAA